MNSYIQRKFLENKKDPVWGLFVLKKKYYFFFAAGLRLGAAFFLAAGLRLAGEAFLRGGIKAPPFFVRLFAFDVTMVHTN